FNCLINGAKFRSIVCQSKHNWRTGFIKFSSEKRQLVTLRKLARRVMQLNINCSQIWYKNVDFQCKKHRLTLSKKTSPNYEWSLDGQDIRAKTILDRIVEDVNQETSPNYDCCLEGQDIGAKTILDQIIGDVNQ
uniref:Transposase n=1 Tax=Romanomermis culicivorax TaxID=13658 RepID=A0A915HYK3_ROMCU